MDNKQLLKKRINKLELQIKQLEQNCSESDVYNNLYNSLLLQKAVMKKQLEELNKNKIIEKLRTILPRKKTLICDYFN